MKSLLDDLKILAECDDMAVWHNDGETNVGSVARRCLAVLGASNHEHNLTSSNAELIEQALAHPPLNAAEKGRLAAVIHMLEPVAENNETVRLYGKEVAVLLKAVRSTEARDD